ncbi:MAG: PilT/PilU family type 4a pilus ATPase [Victivallales bacterium]|jgi:twitching motility protein PilT|nr:PilT/PilU family type 4a pilus ATPase [Victivallales bacterium]
MRSVIHDLLVAYMENKASECQIYEGKPAVLRIEGASCEIPDFAPNDTKFLELAGNLLPDEQIKKLESNDDGEDFIMEDFLLEEDGVARFLVHIQRQRGQLALIVKKTRRDASVFFDILKYAVGLGASDLHVREGKFVRLRVHSRLVETNIMTDTYFFEKSFEQIIPEGRFDIYKKEGDLDFAWEEEGVGRFRVNLHRQRGNSAYTFRYVKGRAPTIKEVNLPEILKKIASFRNGIIFVTGTTGSGKSTTMAAMLDYINNTSEQHVITIEDPIEYTFQDNRSFFEQREIGLDAASFDSALIHALRQDPDIIMVGEMRNRETFETALAAAETGHMVLTTLHTKDAAQSISRILDMFPLEERDSIRKSISECLQAIVCQRLAPRAIGQGVVPINEILINTSIVKKLIFDNQLEKVPQAIAGGEEEGMMSFNQCLLKLAKNGDITEETALKFSDTPQQLQMNLKGIFLSSGGIIQ